MAAKFHAALTPHQNPPSRHQRQDSGLMERDAERMALKPESKRCGSERDERSQEFHPQAPPPALRLASSILAHDATLVSEITPSGLERNGMNQHMQLAALVVLQTINIEARSSATKGEENSVSPLWCTKSSRCGPKK
ncbi:hypothetical protein MHYP_G00154540 [Metynnis hypsauchen]